MNKTPLISICVITYNSSVYIKETLESIKKQTYNNIELIISDDCSTDDTASICNNWLEENRDRFVSVCFSSLLSNSGVPSNCNNAVNKSNGEWLQLIAGDDLLTPNAISDYVDYLNNNPGAQIIFSLSQSFIDNNGYIFGKVRPDRNAINLLKSDSTIQMDALLFNNYLPAPSHLTKRELAFKYRFDEDFRLCEDYPRWLKMASNHVHFHLMEKVTVLYRQHESISLSKRKYVNVTLLLENEKLFFDYIYPFYKHNEELIRYKRAIFFIQEFEVILLKNNKNNLFGRLLLKVIRRILSKWAKRTVSF